MDLNSNGYKESVKLYNYGLDLAKELNEMVSQMEDQTNSKIYKISKPRYSLNDFWTNLDHGHDNLDTIIKRADLSKVVMDWLTEFGFFGHRPRMTCQFLRTVGRLF